MYDGNRDDFYAEELKAALQEWHRVNREVTRLAEERRGRARLVRSLLSVLKLQKGDGGTVDLLEAKGIAALARPFLTLDGLKTAGAATVVRRRAGQRQAVEPATMLQKGTRVRMLSGLYEGCPGVVSSTQVRQGKRGLDVTYFLALEGPGGQRRRTSVKHGALNKSWQVVNGDG
jgi:hypothetical protein